MAEGGGGSVPDHDLRRRFEGQLSKFTNVVKGWQFRYTVSVLDPRWYQCGPGSEPGFGSQPSFGSGTQFRIRIKFSSWKNSFLYIEENAIFFNLGLHEGRQSYKRSLQPSKENIEHFKTRHFKNYFPSFYYCGSFSLSRYPKPHSQCDPDTADQNQCWSVL